MKILFLTDIHENWSSIGELPAADLLLIGGDFTNFGTEEHLHQALTEIRSLWKAPFFAVGGNLDPAGTDRILSQEGLAVPAEWQGLRLFGLSGSNLCPRLTPNQWDDADKEAELSRQIPGRLDILITHAPPKDSGADCIPGGIHVGSTAVAHLAQATTPRLHLCGHIHESVGIFPGEKTILVNPGSFGQTGGYAQIEWSQEGMPQVLLQKLS